MEKRIKALEDRVTALELKANAPLLVQEAREAQAWHGNEDVLTPFAIRIDGKIYPSTLPMMSGENSDKNPQ